MNAPTSIRTHTHKLTNPHTSQQQEEQKLSQIQGHYTR